MMKKTLLGALVAGMLLPTLSFAEAGDWVVRLRAVNVKPNEDSSLGKYVNKNVAPGLMTPSAELKVDSNTIPELDISYYFTKNIAAELILATGTKHDVKISGDSLAAIGNQKLGEVDALPPTLTVQWHFNPDQTFDPYVGAGINATFMLDRYLRGDRAGSAINGRKIKLDRSSFGPALQAGFDINLKDGWLINADVKYVWLDTKVQLDDPVNGGWTKIDSLDINPWVIGVGVGKRF